ncbi:MAG TPA: GNAT family N-acetyltransferase [Trinickia sp.]|uniref:GNAT family N-acetyltransferase n=1 Tax=Trinickia sp. TaxID=2571163 RepID=UPI002F413134
MEIAIRDAIPADASVILDFIKELATYEKAADQVVATVDSIRSGLFGDRAHIRARICEVDGQPAGFALYFFSFSTWQGRKGLYLEDLYVTPRFRGAGAGKHLLHDLARIAVATGCGRFEWSVLDWNEPAIRFYESVGAKPQSEWVRYRLTGDALQAFADDREIKAD